MGEAVGRAAKLIITAARRQDTCTHLRTNLQRHTVAHTDRASVLCLKATELCSSQGFSSKKHSLQSAGLIAGACFLFLIVCMFLLTYVFVTLALL